jgi:hypothetical protein
LSEWLHPVADKPGQFRSNGVGRELNGTNKDVDFVPFYRLHRRTYALYWDLYTSEGWTRKTEALALEQQRKRTLEAATIGFAQPGESEKEKALNQQGEESNVDRGMGPSGRRARKWFSYDLPVEPEHPVSLLVTYYTEERAKRSVEVLVDGQRVGEQTIDRSPPGSAAGSFFDAEYKLPADLLKDKTKVTIRFQATGGNETATVFAVRTVRAEP